MSSSSLLAKTIQKIILIKFELNYKFKLKYGENNMTKVTDQSITNKAIDKSSK